MAILEVEARSCNHSPARRIALRIGKHALARRSRDEEVKRRTRRLTAQPGGAAEEYPGQDWLAWDSKLPGNVRDDSLSLYVAFMDWVHTSVLPSKVGDHLTPGT
jgi:hypothetical protein